MGKQEKNVLSADELSVLCWQLALLTRAGYAAGESVAMLEQDAGTSRARAVLVSLQGALEENLPLSQAMKGSGAFPGYAVNMVEIGQASGRLEQVLGALGEYYRRESEMMAALRRAVSYPAFMAALIAVVFVVLTWQVLPVFQRVFEQLGGAPAAQGLIAFGGAAKIATGVLAALLLCLAAWAGVCMLRGKVPFAGLYEKSRAGRAEMRGRFSSAMALMLASGLPVDEGMDRAAQLLEGTPAYAALDDCRKRVRQGESLSAAVEQSGVLTGLHAGLLAAGARAGAADAAMAEIASRCQQEAGEGLSRLLHRFEYGLIVLLCVVVGAMLLSVMLPLLGVLSAIGG